MNKKQWAIGVRLLVITSKNPMKFSANTCNGVALSFLPIAAAGQAMDKSICRLLHLVLTLHQQESQ